MLAIDTDVLVRLITRDEPQQVAAAEAFVTRGAWISHLVLAEATRVLGAAYSLSPAAIATAIEMLLDHRNLAVEDPVVARAALAHFRARGALGFADCLVLELARKAGHLPLGTFDGELGELSGAQRI